MSRYTSSKKLVEMRCLGKYKHTKLQPFSHHSIGYQVKETQTVAISVSRVVIFKDTTTEPVGGLK